MQKLLLIVGAILVVAGFLWPWLSKLPFGKLPGDMMVDKPNVKVFFPFTSMLIVSVILSVLMWLFSRR